MVDFVCPSIRSYLDDQKQSNRLIIYNRDVKISLKVGQPITNVTIKIGISRDCPIRYNLSRIANYVETVSRWVGSLFWSTFVRDLDITLWLTPLRKTWCPDTTAMNFIGKCEVNSGETFFAGPNRREITIWRAEDWSKVVLHELFHAFNWDRLIPRTSTNASEALVELMANVLHCELLGGPIGWRELFEQEKRWTMNQVNHLRKYRWQPDKTSVSSYYILKGALMNNLPQFRQWLQSNSLDVLHDRWPKLVASSFSLLSSPSTKDGNGRGECISMRMIFSQLALEPIPYNDLE